jgi:hypothetical protein
MSALANGSPGRSLCWITLSPEARVVDVELQPWDETQSVRWPSCFALS